MRIRVDHSIGDLAGDLSGLAKRTRPAMGRVVAEQARAGNRKAKEFASEQHTMFSDVDIDYPKAFTTERRGELEHEYGPDATRPEGSKASGYEFGSVNQASPHANLDRSLDLVRIEYPKAVSDKVGELFTQAGFA